MKPFLGSCHKAPAAWLCHVQPLGLSGTTISRLCASFIIACSVVATAPIVCGNQYCIFMCNNICKSINCNFLSILSSNITSCMLYSQNFQSHDCKVCLNYLHRNFFLSNFHFSNVVQSITMPFLIVVFSIQF